MLGTQPALVGFSMTWASLRRGPEDLGGWRPNYGLEVDPDRMITELSVGERQRVEILKALYREARILILDEPTAVLTPMETEALFATLKKLVGRGAVGDLHLAQARSKCNRQSATAWWCCAAASVAGERQDVRCDHGA